MKITSDISDERVQLVFDGRLDAAWSEPASTALDGAIRSGRSRIELDLAGVTFIDWANFSANSSTFVMF